MPALALTDPWWFAASTGAVLATALALVARHPERVVTAPRRVLAGIAVITLLALLALLRIDPPGLRLSIDPSSEPLLPAGDPAQATYREAVLDFGDDQVYVVAMETQGDVFTTASLRALRRVSDRISRLPGVRSVQSLVGVTSFRWVPEREWIEVRDFIEEVPESAAVLAELRGRALRDPLYRGTLVSLQGRAAALNVSFQKMSDGEFIAADLDGRIREILADEARDGRRFHVSGRPHIKSVMYHAMVRDLSVLIPVTFGVLALVLLAFAGSRRGVVLPLGTVALSIVWTFGCIAWLERPLTVLTVLLAPTLLAIGSVYGVHVVRRYEEEVAGAADAAGAALAALRAMRVPMLIAGLTTVIGFAALLTSDVPAVFEIGAFSLLGVASVTLLSLTGIPAALALLPLRPARPGPVTRRLRAALDAGLRALARSSAGRPGAVIATFCVLVGLALAAIPRIVVDTDYLSFFDADAPVRQEFARINELLAGVVPLFLVVDGGAPGALREPALLRRIEALQRRLDETPGVSRTVSFLDSLRVLNRALSADDPAAERIPDTREAVAELLFLLPKSDLQRLATVDHSRANLVVRTGAVGSAELRALAARIEEAIAQTLPPALTAHVTGNALLLTRAADGVAAGQVRSVGLAAAAILVLLTASLRSLHIGLVAMVPNVVPVLLFFGLLGAGFAPLSLPTSLIGCVALGLAIDSTAHYLVRYRAERERGASPEQAVLRCHESVGRPIATTAMMLMLGFASVAASQFVTLREFGILTSATMGICTLTDLWLLPALLVRARI